MIENLINLCAENKAKLIEIHEIYAGHILSTRDYEALNKMKNLKAEIITNRENIKEILISIPLNDLLTYQDATGNDIMMIATSSHDYEMLEYLLSHFDFNIKLLGTQNKDGNTALISLLLLPCSCEFYFVAHDPSIFDPKIFNILDIFTDKMSASNLNKINNQGQTALSYLKNLGMRYFKPHSPWVSSQNQITNLLEHSIKKILDKLLPVLNQEDLMRVDKEGDSILIPALWAKYDNRQIGTLISKLPKEILNSSNHEGRNALFFACVLNNSFIFNLLCAIADNETLLFKSKNYGYAPLWYNTILDVAIRNNKIEYVSLIFYNLTKNNPSFLLNDDLYLTNAIELGRDPLIIDQLIKYTNHRSPPAAQRSCSPLMKAAEIGDWQSCIKLIKILKDEDINRNDGEYNISALTHSIESINLAIFKLLINKADLNTLNIKIYPGDDSRVTNHLTIAASNTKNWHINKVILRDLLIRGVKLKVIDKLPEEDDGYSNITVHAHKMIKVAKRADKLYQNPLMENIKPIEHAMLQDIFCQRLEFNIFNDKDNPSFRWNWDAICNKLKQCNIIGEHRLTEFKRNVMCKYAGYIYNNWQDIGNIEGKYIIPHNDFAQNHYIRISDDEQSQELFFTAFKKCLIGNCKLFSAEIKDFLIRTDGFIPQKVINKISEVINSAAEELHIFEASIMAEKEGIFPIPLIFLLDKNKGFQGSTRDWDKNSKEKYFYAVTKGWQDMLGPNYERVIQQLVGEMEIGSVNINNFKKCALIKAGEYLLNKITTEELSVIVDQFADVITSFTSEEKIVPNKIMEKLTKAVEMHNIRVKAIEDQDEGFFETEDLNTLLTIHPMPGETQDCE